MLLLLIVLCGILLAGSTAMAQSTYGALSGGYSFLHAEGANGQYTNFNGWYLTPEYNLTKRFSLFVTITGFSGGAEQNIHSYTFGQLLAFPNHSRVKPIVFSEFGDARTSKPTQIANAFAFVLGGGFEVKMNKHVSLQILPAEYVLTTPVGGPRNNYLSQFGLTFPLGKKKKK